MKTTREINTILSQCKHVDSHVHTHLCDGAKDMTVKNIAEAAKARNIDGIILTPHYHKKLSDGITTLYYDTDESIFGMLREEIEHYEKTDGSVKIILATETDIISKNGDISFSASPVAEAALDLVAPTLNYHPCLPLSFVGLTMGLKVDKLHESGEYAVAAEKLGGVAEVLSLMYDAEALAISRCPYPAMLGHLFLMHSNYPYLNNCFGAKHEHLDIMQNGVSRLLSACRSVNAIIDLTGVHVLESQSAEDKLDNNGFLVEFQRFAVSKCRQLGIAAYFGSDSHELSSIGSSSDYYEKLYSMII